MKYKTEEERKQAKKEYSKQYYKQYYQTNKEKLLEQQKQYNQTNKEKIVEYHKQYFRTPMGRASRLVQAHNQEDKKYNRGECTLTARWIVDNIFSQKCIYCGESDWRKLGCDRIDNSKPHTEDNVVPCCEACNNKRKKKPFEEFLTLMTK